MYEEFSDMSSYWYVIGDLPGYNEFKKEWISPNDKKVGTYYHLDIGNIRFKILKEVPAREGQLLIEVVFSLMNVKMARAIDNAFLLMREAKEKF